MARIVYQDEGITEYDDGTEEVTFTEAEWEVMLNDPAFGYVCHNGHRLNDADRRFIVSEGICPTCFNDAENAYYDYLDANGIDEAGNPVEPYVAPEPAPAPERDYDEEPF